MKTSIAILGMALLIVMGLGGSAMAVGNIKIGQIAVHPSITEKGMWDSNIDLNAGSGTKSDGTPFNEPERSDYINTITPALDLNLKKPLLDVRLGAYVDIVRYREYDKNDTENYSVNFDTIYGKIGRKGLYLKISENFLDSKDPYSQSDIADLRYKEGIAIEKKENQAKIEAGYGLLNQFATHFSYANNYLKYDNDEDRNSNKREDIFGCSLFYKIMPKTFLTTAYNYTTSDYFDYDTRGLANAGKDSKTHDVSIGILWDQTRKVNGKISMGYQWKKWDYLQDNAGNRLKDVDAWTISTNLGWKPRERTTVYLYVARELVDSVDDTYYSYDKFAIWLSAEQKILRKLAANIGGKYENNDYNSSTTGARDKEFDLYECTGGVSYQVVKWVKAEINYTYRIKDASSGFEDEEYKDHQTMFKITCSF